ncbi:DMT family transporter [Brevibacillus humidisoli]|uniref:DMT family transporter n=1 Tax=Brevibacillus humidisoli TaxID=2895522 RepID=UPI001E5EDCE8|nr:DMT family transporter [Brevibacillus humidisoli]UFJ41449.1 DMT family transporter [Brevibacillus humidisoli]
MNKYQAWLLLTLTNLFWAGNYLFGKYVTAEVSPLWMTLSRWSIALLLLWPIAMYREKPDWQQLVRSWRPLILLGLLGVIGYNLFLYAALIYTSPTNAALVNALNPALIVLFSAILLRERMSAIKIGGLLLSVLGVVFIVTDGNPLQILDTTYNRGDLLMLGAILVWTFYSIVGKRLDSIPPITATAASATLAVLVLIPFGLVDPPDVMQISNLSLTGILYMAIFPSVGSYMLWNVALRFISASQAGVSLHLIPVFTVLIGFLLGEIVTLAQIVGGLLVFAGVSVTTGFLEQLRQKKSTLTG